MGSNNVLLPTLRKLFKGDYKEEFQELIETMIPTVNNGVEVLYDALNGKISIRDNIQCVVKDINLSVNSSGIPVSLTTFTLNSIARIDGCEVIKVENLTNSSTYPTGAPFITYNQTDNRITINHITGLIAGNNYRIRVIAYG